MLLATDIGNTDIKVGVFEGSQLRSSWRWSTDRAKLCDEYAAQLGWLLDHSELSFAAVRRTVISSVVPEVTEAFIELSRRYLGCEPLRVSAAVEAGMPLAVDNPPEVGGDRIANAVAAKGLYRVPAIIVDFGTATNFDVVSRDGVFIGGCFAPGLRSALDGLLARAAQLQSFELVAPARTIGTNTVACLQSGAIYGYVGLVEGLVARIERELGGEAVVIGTGGLVEIIAAETDAIDVVDPHLTLHGLRVLADLNPVGGQAR